VVTLVQDPNNIASVNVLKGLAAATLYGTAGKNGVIVITTKSGSASNKGPKKTEITVNQSYFVNEIASMPDYQNKYGGGFDLLNNEYTGQRYAWQPYESVENFFRSGGVSNTNLAIAGQSDDGTVSYNVNYGHLDEKGFTPGNGIRRNTLSIGGRAKLSNKFTASGSINYTNNSVISPPVASSGGNGTLGWSTFGNVFFTPRNVDLMGLPFEIPETGGSIYYRNGNDIINPRWSVKNSQGGQVTNRIFGTAQLNYEYNDNLTFTYRYGLDWYNERNTAYSNKDGVNFNQAIFGYLDTWDNNVSVSTHYASVNGNYDLSDEIGMSFVVGATSQNRSYDREGVGSSGQIVFGVLQHFNFENQTPISFHGSQNTVGVFASTDLDYNDDLFATLSNPDMKSDNLSYLKVRAGYGTSAGFPGGYPTVNSVNQSTNVNGGLNGGIITNSVSDFQANPDLKPELLGEFELGFDARLFNNRLGVNASYFERTSTDLIVNKPLPTSTGFTSTQDNIGKVEGDGVELDLDFDVMESNDGLNWNARVNFTTSNSIVTEQEDDQIIFAGSTSATLGGNAAIEGEQLGVIVGTRIERNDSGQYVVNASGGSRSITPIIGNPNPDYVMNVINTISYKNFNLGFQMSHTAGGDIASSTVATLLGRGGVPVDRKNTFILPGVLGDGSPNNLQINNSSYYFNNVLFGPKELSIYDGSVLRLQEISLGYSFPQDMLDKTPFGSLSITATGFNLWYDAYNMPEGTNFDPNVAGTGVGNGRGFDYLNGPSSKRYGISLKASF